MSVMKFYLLKLSQINYYMLDKQPRIGEGGN